MMIAMWSVPIIAVVCAVIFLRFNEQSRQQARIDAANKALEQAVAEAEDWIDGGELTSGTLVQEKLEDAISDENVTETASGSAVLEKVNTRVNELRADQVFMEAQRELNDGDVETAISLLEQYVRDPNATQETDARRLLHQAAVARSDEAAFNALVALDDTEFADVEVSEILDDGVVTHPVLVGVRNENVARNLNRARQQREAERLALLERERREEELRLAQEEQARLEEERRQRALEYERRRQANQEAALLGSVFGHWRSSDGQHLFVDADQHIIIGSDGERSDPLPHKRIRRVTIPADGRLQGLSSEQQQDIGDLLEMLSDVALEAFGRSDDDIPRADFYIIEGEPKQVLSRKLQITEIIAFVRENYRQGEWVRVINLGGNSEETVSTIRFVDARRTPE